MPTKPHDMPITAVAEGGEIVLDGPNGLATSLTPSAASKSAQHLCDAVASAARDAREQASGDQGEGGPR